MQLLSRASRNEDERRRISSGKQSDVYMGPEVEKPSVFEKQGRTERKSKERELSSRGSRMAERLC